jgi:hypothetical protein
MHRFSSSLAVSIALIALVPIGAFAQHDTDSPELVDFDFTPNTVDVTAGSAAVTCEMSFVDSISGVESSYCFFYPPSGSPTHSCPGELVSGDAHNGSYACDVVIPQYVEAGLWRARVSAQDEARNVVSHLAHSLAELGFPSLLEVTSNEDNQPPTLVDFDFNPKSVDVTAGSATVTCEMTLADPLSGVASSECFFFSPPGSFYRSCLGSLDTGDLRNGTHNCDVVIPQYSREGTWSVFVSVTDEARNGRAYTETDLANLGFPSQLDVTSNEDIEPPTLVSFNFDPRNVDVTGDSRTVSCEMSVTDSAAGVGLSLCRLLPPRGFPQQYCYGTLASGDELDGTYTCDVVFPQYVEEGTWRVVVVVQDLVENSRGYLENDLAELGFPSLLDVEFLNGPPRAAIAGPLDGSRVRGNSLTIRGRLNSGNPGDLHTIFGVLFKYRSLPDGSFSPIPARTAIHPNPDATYPYFIHWDVSGVADGDYELRAVAHDLDGIPDPSPEAITITIAQTGVVDIDENFSEENVQESHSGVSNGGDSFVESADSIDASTVTALVIPAGALTLSSDTAILSYSDFLSELAVAQEVEQIVGAVVDFTLESGQADFESGLTGDLIISYSDYDQDGYVDGTGIPESGLELRYYDPVADAYVPMPSWTVMTEHNMVHADTPFTGRFAVIPEPSRLLMLSAGMCLLTGLYRLRRRA